MAAIRAVPQELLLIFESAAFLHTQNPDRRRLAYRFIFDNGVRNACYCEHAAEIERMRRDFVLP